MDEWRNPCRYPVASITELSKTAAFSEHTKIKGEFAVCELSSVCSKAYAIGKKEKPPFEEQPESEEKEDPVPDELLCLICRDLLSDAVLIPCCGNSYCDDCECLTHTHR